MKCDILKRLNLNPRRVCLFHLDMQSNKTITVYHCYRIGIVVMEQ